MVPGQNRKQDVITPEILCFNATLCFILLDITSLRLPLSPGRWFEVPVLLAMTGLRFASQFSSAS
jgi:hypothetical protein